MSDLVGDLVGVGLVAATLLFPHGIWAGAAAAEGEETSAEFSQAVVMGQVFGLMSGFVIYKWFLEY